MSQLTDNPNDDRHDDLENTSENINTEVFLTDEQEAFLRLAFLLDKLDDELMLDALIEKYGDTI